VRKPLTGYSATPVLTTGQLLELYELRLLLEPKATEIATKRLTREGEDLLKAELNTIKKLRLGDTYAEYRSVSEHDARFHQLIFHLCGNEFMESAYLKTHCHLRLFRLSPTSSAAQNQAVQEHKKIVRAMVTRDTGLARAAMIGHLESSRSRMLPFLLNNA